MRAFGVAWRLGLGVALAAVLATGLAACAHRPVTCDSTGACGAQFSCGPSACSGAKPISSASPSGRASDAGKELVSPKSQRIVLGPTQVEIVGGGHEGVMLQTVTVGREGEPVSVLLEFTIPRDVEVTAAYLLVDRADDGTSDGAGVGLHAERIVGVGASAALEDTKSPSLHLRPGGPQRLRVEVGFLRGRKTGPYDQGVALVTDQASPSGVSLTLSASLSSPLPGESSPEGLAATTTPRAPRLELYVK